MRASSEILPVFSECLLGSWPIAEKRSPDAIDLIIRMPEGLRSPEAMHALFAEHDSQVDGPPLT